MSRGKIGPSIWELKPEEIQKLKDLEKSMSDNIRPGFIPSRRPQTFRLGDLVRIVSGPFVSFTGRIEGINQAKAHLKVKVTIYGRHQPIRLNFRDVEKVLESH